MLNMKINNEPTFTGINVAKVTDKNIKIYDITTRDAEFLDNIYKYVKIKHLMPEISIDGEKVYDSIMKQGLKSAQSNLMHGTILSYNDIVCGFMVENLNKKKHYLEYICTWPIEKNKKAPFGAQTLFVNMFQNFLNSEKNIAELDAVKYGKAISLYKKLSYKPVGGDAFFETMRTTKEKIKNVLIELQEKIPLTPVFNTKDVDLQAELKIPIE